MGTTLREACRCFLTLSSLDQDLSFQVVLAKIDSTVVLDTLEVLVMHLGRVAEADNRMDIENLGLLFGQVTNDFIHRFYIFIQMFTSGISVARPDGSGRHAVLFR